MKAKASSRPLAITSARGLRLKPALPALREPVSRARPFLVPALRLRLRKGDRP